MHFSGVYPRPPPCFVSIGTLIFKQALRTPIAVLTKHELKLIKTESRFELVVVVVVY